jgi:hypothetical protein
LCTKRVIFSTIWQHQEFNSTKKVLSSLVLVNVDIASEGIA